MDDKALKNAVRRLNRQLASEGLVVKKTRSRALSTLGDYYCLELRTSTITAHHVDPLAWLEEK
ncbi:MAG TPA: hypothetical protein VFG04_03855 [Planctomycetaceae bacterium]|nr:hypothetical protein [Planctomycetaceae bacterium]